MDKMLDFITSRTYATNEPLRARKFRECWLKSSKSLYHKVIKGHEGCVNAIEFSADGQLLFSGGDDLRVRLWDINRLSMEDEDYPAKTKSTKLDRAHTSNIFCLAVDQTHNRVISAGNDDQIVVFDYKTEKLVNVVKTASPIFGLSLRSDNSEIFATAEDNGRILVYDLRTDLSGYEIVNKTGAFGGVMFHPLDSYLLATANYTCGFHAWDIRKPRVQLKVFSAEPGMSVRWDSTGRRLLCLSNQLPPLIVDPKNTKKRIEFDSENFYSSCTMKSGCFAGENEDFILAGSDDFNVYMWQVPKGWPRSKMVKKEHMILRGHRSIVNQVRYNMHNQLIATCGVEKIIKLWSPIKLPGTEGDREFPMPESLTRELCVIQSCRRIHAPAFNSPPPGADEDTSEDFQMLHFFDTLVHDEIKKKDKPFVNLKQMPEYNRRALSFYSKLLRQKRKRFRDRIASKSEGNGNALTCSIGMPIRMHDMFMTWHLNIRRVDVRSDSDSDESIDDESDHDANEGDVIEEVAAVACAPPQTWSQDSSSGSSGPEDNTFDSMPP